MEGYKQFQIAGDYCGHKSKMSARKLKMKRDFNFPYEEELRVEK